MPHVYLNGDSEYYEESKVFQDKCPEIDSNITGVQEKLIELDNVYNEMIALVPKFGDAYDALGSNSKVNLEVLQETIKSSSTDLETINGENGYKKEAIIKDESQTERNRNSALNKLRNRTKMNA